ncbi:MAG: Uma2 family endonuclease [Cytophagales bacterium]
MKKEVVANFTIDDFFALEAKSDFKHEFQNGEIYDMAGVLPKHNNIMYNFYSSSLLWCQRKKKCKIFSSDQLVNAAFCDAIYYPDVVIICENIHFFGHEGTGFYAPTNWNWEVCMKMVKICLVSRVSCIKSK